MSKYIFGEPFPSSRPEKALEAIYTEEMVDAHEAWWIGLVNKVVSADQLETMVLELTDKIKNQPSWA